jgi:cell wall-associated NlpC family hydrolase
MQAAMLGPPLPSGESRQRGDLVFWRGHVGILADAGTLIHANAYHMAVVQEPLSEATRRIAEAGGGGVTLRLRPRAGWSGRDPAGAQPARRA